MWHGLIRHPDYPCDAVQRIEVAAERPSPALLVLRYRLTGVTDALVLPVASPPDRTDDLWRHTCLEAFVLPDPGDAYTELNLSPGGPWAAYHFDDYRHDMSLAQVPPPETQLGEVGGGILGLTAIWDLDHLRPLAPWRVGASAVIEEPGGRLSYWALAHRPGRPDFHKADCFTLELPAPDGP